MAYQDLTLEQYVQALSQPNAMPAGGSACALAGALAAGLASMTAALGVRVGHAELEPLKAEAADLQTALLADVQRDSDAYASYLEARKKARIADEWSAPDEALTYAAEVPLDVAERSLRVIELIRTALPICPAHARPDGLAGIALAQAAIRASVLNAKANAAHLSDADLKKGIHNRAASLESRLERM